MQLRHLAPLALTLALTPAFAPVAAQDVTPANPVVPIAAPAEVAPAEVEPAQVEPAEVEPDQVDPTEVEPSEVEDAAPAASEAATPSNGLSSETQSQVPLDEIRRYVAVYTAVKEAYVEPVDDEKLMHSAIRGLLLDLDPHSMYFDRDDAENFEQSTRGNYDGIGVEIFRQPDGMLRVIAPIDDTPAARAGIKAGDLIIAIDGKPLTPGEDDSFGPLRGLPGSSVVLTIVRDGVDAPLDIKVERTNIRIESVRSRMLEPGYGYVRISAFQADTAADFERQLETLSETAGGRLRGVVIDLRSNPGGLLTSAVQIADDLLETGTIVSTRGRIAISDAVFAATPGDRLEGAPVVVLVDAGSASASEVLAGALRDNDRARVVGSRTFGKGSVQTLLPLDNGDSVKLTTARYYTPSGKSIQALGIIPDVTFKPTTDAAGNGTPARTEAALAGHLRGDGDDLPGINAGDVLDGDSFIAAALAELRKPAAAAVVLPAAANPAPTPRQ